MPKTSNIAFDFVEAEAILMLLDQIGLCASSGSACTTGSLDPSHVLTAMGVNPMRARGCIRFSLGISLAACLGTYLVVGAFEGPGSAREDSPNSSPAEAHQ